METRIFGRTGMRLSLLGFGCGAVGGLMVRGDPLDQERTVARAVAAGVNYFDTAVQYGDGESEKNLRQAFETAEAISPVVLWIDEIEKAFAGASSSESDAGLGRRLFGSFLTWMQEKKDAVFVAATANDLTALPPELQRKGRFDEIFFIDLPDAEERREIFGIHLRQRHQQPEQFDLEAVTVASEGFSGAEIEQALVAGLYGILAENAEALTTERVLNELRNTVPLSRSRREYVEKFRQYAKGRFLPAR